MTTDEFIIKWITKKADWDGYYEGQCVDLFRYYCDEVLKIPQPAGVWGAANFWSDFDTDPILVQYFNKIENTEEFIPKKGDVAIWNFKAGGGYGHVSVVDRDDNTTRYFYSFDQNWSKISYCEIVKHTYTNIFGFLRPKVNSMSDQKCLPINEYDDLKTDSNNWKFLCTKYDINDPSQIVGKIAEYEAKITGLENTNEDNQQTIKELVAEIEELREQFSTQGETLTKAVSEKESLTDELNQRGLKISELEKEIKELTIKLDAIPQTPEMTPTWKNLLSMFRLVLWNWLRNSN